MYTIRLSWVRLLTPLRCPGVQRHLEFIRTLYVANRQHIAASCTLSSQVKYLQVANGQYYASPRALEFHLYVANSQYDAALCTLTSQVKYLQVAKRQWYASTCTWNLFVRCNQSVLCCFTHFDFTKNIFKGGKQAIWCFYMDFESLKKILVPCKQAVCCCFMNFNFTSKIFAGCIQAVLCFYMHLEFIYTLQTVSMMLLHGLSLLQKKYYTVGNRQYDAFKWISIHWKKNVCCKQAILCFYIHLEFICTLQTGSMMPLHALCLHQKNVCGWETGSMMLLRRFQFTRKKNCCRKQAVCCCFMHCGFNN